MSRSVAVLGGGLAGLSCAYELARAGAEVTVLEREPDPGAMASSFTDWHGPAHGGRRAGRRRVRTRVRRHRRGILRMMSLTSEEPLSDAPTENVSACPLCHSPLHSTLFREPPYEIRRCGACGLGYVTPRRSAQALAAMYGEDSYWHSPSPRTHGYGDYRSEQSRYRRTFAKRLDYALKDGPAGGRALDVGAAAGFCMAVLSERGFDVFGVEVSAVIAGHAQTDLGFGDRVFVGFLQDAPLAAHSFDLICMWDVVEHVPDPVALLRRARELLAPGGRLVIETQDIDSAFARALGPRWHHFKHAEHIYHFNPATIRRLLGASGFAVERLSHRYGGKYVSSAFIAERVGRLSPAVSRAAAPLAERTAAHDLYLNFMDEMIVVARGT